MAYNEKKPYGFYTILPTRTGTPSGGANERQMLDGLGGSTGYRSSFRNNPDGSVVRVDTKNGQPQFSTTPPRAVPVVDYTVYLESGQLAWSYPAPANPTRLQPATWNLLDIGSTADYLGRIKGVDPSLAQQTVAVTSGQESLSIGYPRSTDPTVDEVRKNSYAITTVLKKMVAGMYAPSLFSGKMRLFMQAQYGAEESLSAPFPLSVEVQGQSTLLKYSVGGDQLQLGFWAHNTPGIFTALDGSFWLVVITTPSTGTVTATGYAITPRAKVAALVAKYKAGGLSAAEKTQLEGYIFAYSDIDVAHPKSIGSYAGPAGAAMAYGWKWNSDGSKASIVLNERINSGSTERWMSRTVQLTFADSGAGQPPTMAGQTVANGEWIDGWGVYNIFTPPDEISTAPLNLFTIHLGFPRPATFDFTDVAVYGYYKDDIWTEVKLSRHDETGPFPLNRMSETNIILDPAVDMTSIHRAESGVVGSEQNCSWTVDTISAADTMSISVGAWSYAGKSSYGTHTLRSRTVTGPMSSKTNGANFTSTVATNTPTGAPTPQRPYPPASGYYSGGTNYLYVAPCALDSWSFTGTKAEAWSLVIPGGDCEAVYVAQRSFGNGAYSHSQDATTEAMMGFHGFTDDGSPYDFFTWVVAPEWGNWYGVSGVLTQISDATPPPEPAIVVTCFSSALGSIAGVPGGSYETLFSVDWNFPYYSRGMYSYTSYGKRYAMSEGPIYPATVNPSARFVGWA